MGYDSRLEMVVATLGAASDAQEVLTCEGRGGGVPAD
jgi:hypothetical protein